MPSSKHKRAKNKEGDEEALPHASTRHEGEATATATKTPKKKTHTDSDEEEEEDDDRLTFTEWIHNIPIDIRLNPPAMDEMGVLMTTMKEVRRRALDTVQDPKNDTTVVDVLGAMSRLRTEREIYTDQSMEDFELTSEFIAELQTVSSHPVSLPEVQKVIRENAKSQFGSAGVLVDLFAERVPVRFDQSATRLWLRHLQHLDRSDAENNHGIADLVASYMAGNRIRETDDFLHVMHHASSEMRQTIEKIEKFDVAEDAQLILQQLEELAHQAANMPYQSNLWASANKQLVRCCEELYELVRVHNLPSAAAMNPPPAVRQPEPVMHHKCRHGHECVRRQSHTARNPGRWFFACNICSPQYFKWEDEIAPQQQQQPTMAYGMYDDPYESDDYEEDYYYY